MPYHVSQPEFAQLVEQALAELPPPFANALDEVAVEICQVPSERDLKALGLGVRRLLLGLYRGRPLTTRSVEETGRLPDVVYIYKANLEQVCDTADELVREVRKTVLHELGHHFGMSEKDLSELGYG